MPRKSFKKLARGVDKVLLSSDVRDYLGKVVEILGDSLIEISIFGSTARGERRKDSDIDILVIVRGDRRDAFEALNKVFDSLGDLWLDLVGKGALISHIVVGDEEWEWMKKIGMPFALNVEEEKIVLYRKGSRDIYY